LSDTMEGMLVGSTCSSWGIYSFFIWDKIYSVGNFSCRFSPIIDGKLFNSLSLSSSLTLWLSFTNHIDIKAMILVTLMTLQLLSYICSVYMFDNI
jgi:hypothetical protein